MNAETKHTPGPWRVERDVRNPAYVYVRSDNALGQVATVYERPSVNAPLIAAAPELLAALKAALPHVERLASFAPTTNANMGKVMQARKDRDLIAAAIAKAEGH